jgi:hypothetical protein
MLPMPTVTWRDDATEARSYSKLERKHHLASYAPPEKRRDLENFGEPHTREVRRKPHPRTWLNGPLSPVFEEERL